MDEKYKEMDAKGKVACKGTRFAREQTTITWHLSRSRRRSAKTMCAANEYLEFFTCYVQKENQIET